MIDCLASIPEIIQEARKGQLFILIDDEMRENEGDLILSARHATPEQINFMATHGRGLICLAMAGGEIDRLQLPQMTDRSNDNLRTAFTVSIDAKDNVSTGISAFDRAQTIQMAVNPQSTKEDFQIPGHIFPLRAHENGIMGRAGHTEASIEISKLAGMGESAVICEIMNDDGTMARLPDLLVFAKKHKIKIASITALINYLKISEVAR